MTIAYITMAYRTGLLIFLGYAYIHPLLARLRVVASETDEDLGHEAMTNCRFFRIIGLATLLMLNSAQAAIVRFEFSGVLERPIGGNWVDFPEPPIVDQGATYSGSWTVDTGSAGDTYHGPCCVPISGKQYSASDIRFQLGPYILNQANPEFVTITSGVVPDFPQFWPSGYSSDYGVFGALSQNDFLNGNAHTIQFFFSRDGNDFWNSNFDQPENADFFSAMDVGGTVYIAGNIVGNSFDALILPIRNLSSTVVPVPGMWPMFLFAISVVRRQKPILSLGTKPTCNALGIEQLKPSVS